MQKSFPHPIEIKISNMGGYFLAKNHKNYKNAQEEKNCLGRGQ